MNMNFIFSVLLYIKPFYLKKKQVHYISRHFFYLNILIIHIFTAQNETSLLIIIRGEFMNSATSLSTAVLCYLNFWLSSGNLQLTLQNESALQVLLNGIGARQTGPFSLMVRVRS